MKKYFCILAATLSTFACISQVGIGTLSPHSTLDIRGSMSTSYRTFTGNSVAGANDNVLVFAGTEASTLELPSAVGIAGRRYHIKNASVAEPVPALTISTTGSETIDGVTSWKIDVAYGGIKIISNGTNWNIVSDISRKVDGGSTGEGVVIESGFANLGNPDDSYTGELQVHRYIPSGNNTIIFKGNGTNNGVANIAFRDSLVAGIGSPKTKTWMQFDPLMPGQGSVPFAFTQSVTKYGSNRGNEVFNFGWNLSPGGGLLEAGKAAIGYSIESNFDPDNNHQPLVEMHDFYVNPSGKQYRLRSYTISTATDDIDYYNTISRHYWKNPVGLGIYASLTPGNFSISGSAPSFILNNSVGSRTHSIVSQGTNNEVEITGGGFRVSGKNTSGIAILAHSNSGGTIGLSNDAGTTDYFIKNTAANGGFLDLVNGATAKKTMSFSNSGNTIVGRGAGSIADNNHVMQVTGQNGSNFNLLSVLQNVAGSGPGVSYLYPLTLGSTLSHKGSFRFRFYSNDPGDGSGSDNSMLQVNPFGTAHYTSFAAGGNMGIRLGSAEVPTTTLDINGTLRMRGGNPGSGKVMTSDANGYAVWSSPSSLNVSTALPPSSSADATGEVGEIRADGNYIYVKTADGWKRSALETF